ncbi:SapC family protein [Roseateles violae]|uniref:SapC family protein n=1 Tax=Roseateles violae TaxID=3058042 RepID=A0ABT8DVT3_9BURK|nr:SapC family protein [Pelomonas sp. PFR6]MDN3922098.1 SapC family protein [Pelomonas sp. PFR6]
MSKQLLIYETAVPVSAGRHANVSLEPSADYAFTATINAVPLMAVEFLRAAVEYAIVFTIAGDEVLPAAVLGVKGDQNLYLAADRQWQAKYVPAFIRRYPFVFSGSADGKTLTLCIDESHPGVNREGRGERLFGEDGKPTAYVERVLKFLQEYQAQFERTRQFGRKVRDLGLLEPMQAQVTTPAGAKLSLNGFHGVSREKLRKLDGEALAGLAKTDELELLYLQMHSMRNFIDIKDRLIGTLSEETVAEAPATTGEAA